MRIAFVTLGYKPFRTSGFDVSGERLARLLLEAGHMLTIIAAQGRDGAPAEVEAHPALQIYRLPLGRSDWIGYAWRAARQLARLGDFDVTHFWDVHFAYACHRPYLATLHQSFAQRTDSLETLLPGGARRLARRAYYALARQAAELPALRRARGLMAVSQATRSDFIARYAIPPERIALARHGIDTQFFCPRPAAETRALRCRLGIDPHEPVLLFAGFITPRKGFEYLAQAMNHIHPAPRLVLVGGWRSQGYRAQVLEALGPARSRLIEAGFVADEAMPLYYSLADVYVSASLLEGFGLPLAEALACQTPVVTTAAGAAEEVAGPGGVIVPPRDAAALAQAVSSLLADPTRRQEMAGAGRAYVEQNFSLPAMLQATLDAYRRFL